MPPRDWNARAVIESLPLTAWEGAVWRAHWRNLAPDDWRLSLGTTGRFHRGQDLFPPEDVFPALYTSLEPHVAVGEMVRQRASSNLLFLQNNRLSQLRMSLKAVLDCSDPTVLALEGGDIHGVDRAISWAIGAAAVDRGADALIVPSAALEGCNLVVFPTNLPDDWSAEVIGIQEMPIELPEELLRTVHGGPL